MKIYVASSWCNLSQPAVVSLLRMIGHEVYDFRHPPNSTGFSWSQVDPQWEGGPVSAERERSLLAHPIAVAGHAADMGALDSCDALVYVLPCGRSASWEFGYAMGRGKPCHVLWVGDHEPELMFRGAKIHGSFNELITEMGA